MEKKCNLKIAAVLACSAPGLAQAYKQTNVDSDIQGLAQNPPNGQPDAQLLTPGGLIASLTSPWWLSDNNAGVSTLDDGQGVKQGLLANIPSPVNGVAGTPTGVVFTGASGFMFQAKGTTASSVFTFVTEDGTIVAWGPGISPDLPNDSFVVVDNFTNPTAATGAVYKAAAIAQMTAGAPIFPYPRKNPFCSTRCYQHNFKPLD